MATAERTVGTSLRMAARSSHVRVGIEPNPPIAPPRDDVPGSTTMMFDPIDANVFSTCALAPSPTATIEITAKTPMMMPSVVRNERSLFRSSARTAMRNVSKGLTRRPPHGRPWASAAYPS